MASGFARVLTLNRACWEGRRLVSPQDSEEEEFEDGPGVSVRIGVKEENGM